MTTTITTTISTGAIGNTPRLTRGAPSTTIRSARDRFEVTDMTPTANADKIDLTTTVWGRVIETGTRV